MQIKLKILQGATFPVFDVPIFACYDVFASLFGVPKKKLQDGKQDKFS